MGGDGGVAGRERRGWREEEKKEKQRRSSEMGGFCDQADRVSRASSALSRRSPNFTSAPLEAGRASSDPPFSSHTENVRISFRVVQILP